jgi:hypothetical protein
MGDSNAHYLMWDSIQPTDARGDNLADWIMDNELELLNNGDPTRKNPETGNDNFLDVTFCGVIWCEQQRSTSAGCEVGRKFPSHSIPANTFHWFGDIYKGLFRKD